jgi:Spy/CpxP family protein refolding chaperone
MTKMLFAAALLVTAVSAPVFAADVPAKPPTPPAAEVKPAAKPMPMHHMKAMPMKASAKTTIKPAREPSTDKLNQEQLDNFKKS